MKKLRLIILCVCVSIGITQAQIDFSQTEFGIRGGLNVAGFAGDIGRNIGSKAGFHLGVIADVEVAENIYVQPGLYLTMKGAKESYQGDKITFNPTYLQIPILASYRVSLTEAVEWQINLGPYFAIGLGGKYKYKDGDDPDDDYDYPLFKKDSYSVGGTRYEDPAPFKRFDAGLSFGTGITYNDLYFGLSYDVGLVNFANADALGRGVSAKNKAFLISIGYNF